MDTTHSRRPAGGSEADQAHTIRDFTSVERRMIEAWRASGTRLGKLVVAAANAYALAASESLYGIVDDALIEMCERWAKENQRP